MPDQGSKSKVVAGLLGIFPPTGALGIHRFYLGYKNLAFLHIALLVVGLPMLFLFGLGLFPIFGNIIWAVIEGIMIFAGAISKDADGRSLVG